MKSKILFALTSNDRLGNTGRSTGFYLAEAAHPWMALARFDIDFMSPKGGKPPIDGADMSDAMNREFLDSEIVKRKLASTLTPRQVDAHDYGAILFVGGHGTMWDFPSDAGLAGIAADIYE